MEQQKLFETTPLRQCNSCQHYYTNTCDGVKLMENKTCRDYKVIRLLDVESLLNENNIILKNINAKINVTLGIVIVNLVFTAFYYCGII